MLVLGNRTASCATRSAAHCAPTASGSPRSASPSTARFGHSAATRPPRRCSRVCTGAFPGVSLPTVYAGLELLADLGLALRVRAGRAVRYDPRVDPHHHFVCDTCGAVGGVDAAVDLEPALAGCVFPARRHRAPRCSSGAAVQPALPLGNCAVSRGCELPWRLARPRHTTPKPSSHPAAVDVRRPRHERPSLTPPAPAPSRPTP